MTAPPLAVIMLEGLPTSVDPIKTNVLGPVTFAAKFVLLSRRQFCMNAVLTAQGLDIEGLGTALNGITIIGGR